MIQKFNNVSGLSVFLHAIHAIIEKTEVLM
jgi:hypothetical protein